MIIIYLQKHSTAYRTGTIDTLYIVFRMETKKFNVSHVALFSFLPFIVAILIYKGELSVTPKTTYLD